MKGRFCNNYIAGCSSSDDVILYIVEKGGSCSCDAMCVSCASLYHLTASVACIIAPLQIRASSLAISSSGSSPAVNLFDDCECDFKLPNLNDRTLASLGLGVE